MKARLKFLVTYFIYWLCLFILAKVLFLFYQYNQSFAMSIRDWAGVFIYGFRLDLSTAAYFTLLPVVIILVTSFLNYRPVYYMIGAYTVMMIIVFLIITFVDLEVYKYWGSRLDSAPLRFLGKPKEVLASSSILTLMVYILALGSLIWGLNRSYNRLVARFLKDSPKPGIPGVVVFTFLAALLFLPIRGGIGPATINTASAYFSRNAFANHAAINVEWNFGQSLIDGQATTNRYSFYHNSGYDKGLHDLYRSEPATEKLLKTDHPNIVLIIMETFTAKIVEPLGGVKGITPEFNSFCKNGILFSNIYSTDSRTDKGMATILSGYPVLDAIPILQYPNKTQNLPFITRNLNKIGYHASFLYGGDIEFANMRSYLVNGNFTKITSLHNFSSKERTGNWGASDQVTLDRFFKEIKADTGRWFHAMLTLSNHEPFDIPTGHKFPGDDLKEKFYSSAYYADSCVGDFIRRMKADKELWDNTLIIIVADHGSRLPDFSQIFEPRKHHIPLLWTGGVVAKDTVVAKIGSQADLAVTLLHQMGLPTDEYVLGKDLLSPSAQSFAFYSIKNGIAMITDTSGFGYDFTSKEFSYKYGKVDSTHLALAKSLQQYVFGNYLDLSRKSRIAKH
jgi:phosphoglycerol transferase MdoB-like AlkP superfamily enzyme